MSLPSPTYSDALLMPDHALPIGTRVDSFRITGLIGEGGFGVVYRAYDAILQRDVALKEYLPANLASRADGSVRVMVRTTRSRESFEAGLQCFVNEARMLARFDHPALLKVHRFWEGNGTAYMAMPYYEGPTLKQVLAARGSPPDEAQLRAWLMPLLDALATLHAAGCLHRDIAPDNIVITTQGPVLLDFGAARQIVSGMTKGLTVMLKPGFAPVEQYAESANTPQGPWTDLYALAAVLSFAITGATPASAVERVLDDHQPLLWRQQIGRYHQTFLHAIDTALAVRPGQRPQSVAQWLRMLEVPAAGAITGGHAAQTSRRKSLWVAGGVAAALLALALGGQRGEVARHEAEGGGTQAAKSVAPTVRAEPAAAAVLTREAQPSKAAPAARPDLAALIADDPPAAGRIDAGEDIPEAPKAATAPEVPAAVPMAMPTAVPTVVKVPERAAKPAPPRPIAVVASHTVTHPLGADATRGSTACRSLIQHGSLRTLSAEEAALLKKECR